MRPAIAISRLFHRSSQSPHQHSVAPEFVPSPLGFHGWFWRAAVADVIGLLGVFVQVLRVDELGTGVDEGHGGFALSEAKDGQTGLKDPHN